MGQNLQLHIEGMTCTSCASAVEKALSNVPQVKVAQVNFAGHKALLELDDGAESGATSPDSDHLQKTLRKAVHDAGYSVVDPAERRAEADKHLRRERNRLIWSWVVTLPLTVQMLLHMVWDIHILPMAVSAWTTPILAGVVIFGIGRPVIRSTINSFRKLAFTMDSLIGIGAAAAFSTGILRLAGVAIDDFTAIGAMIVAINYIGNYIKVKATGRASSAIQQLLEMGAKQATRLTPEGSEELIDVAELQVGDTVRVRPGEKVPADGTITRGSTSIDESIVSGESVPVDKEQGSAVVGATINQMGTIEVRIERTGEDTFLSQIVELVEEAQSSRVPVQELADRVTAIFVPAILVLSLLTFGGWMALTAAGIVGSGGMNVSAALSAAIATLVIACPCALGLATPTALMVGMGYGAERGILVRNGEAIQTARGLDTVVFDKTGTLTVGRPEVRRSEHYTPGPADVAPGQKSAPLPDPRLLTLTVEQQSEHPLARAIRSHLEAETADGGGAGAAEPSGSTLEIDNVEAVPGHGIRSTISNHPVLVGSIRWLTSEGIALEEAQRATAEEWKRDGMTVVGTAADGRLVGMYGLADAIKEDAHGAIAGLHRLGLRTAMLTGDNDTAARAIAGRAGIDDVFAELLPAQKIEAVQKLQGEGRTVAMVGDGINDAPALKQANVGIAIGTGTDIAIESADITLMSSSLGMIPRAVEISRSTFGKIKTNLFWAFIYNVVAIPLAVMGLLHPVVAEIAMAFSSITVVSNSLHLKRILKKEERRHDMGLFGKSNTVEYTVPDISCGHCEAKVTAALQGVDGIKKVKASAKNKNVVIEYTGESAPDLETVNKVLEPAGYPAQQG
ncbi:MAG: heavy metal translocating P-type ATPase [Alkalispirochaeta sp.]